MRHLGEVRDDVAALDVLAEADDHRVVVTTRLGRSQDVAEADHLLVGVGDLDADRGLARDRAEDAHLVRGDRVGDVLAEGRDLLDLDRRAELDLVPGDGGSPGVARDGRVDLELLQHLGQTPDDGVGGLAPRLVRRALAEHRAVREGVQDVAGELELFGAGRERLHRGALGGLLVDLVDGRDGPLDAGRRRDRRGDPLVVRIGDDGVLVGLVDLELGTWVPPGPVRGRVALVGRATREAVTDGLHLLRDRMDRGVAQDQHTEGDDEHQQWCHDEGRLEQVDQDRREQVADGPSCVTDGGHVVGARHSVGHVHEAQHATDHGGPGDGLTAGRALRVGVPQGAPGDDDEHDRDGAGQHADTALADLSHAAAHRAGNLPPGRRGRDDREADDRQAHAVATLGRVEVAGAAADRARDRADRSGETEPDRPEHATEAGHDGGETATGSAALRGRLLGRRPAVGRGSGRASLAARAAAGLGTGRPLARRGRRSGRHGESLKEDSSLSQD